MLALSMGSALALEHEWVAGSGWVGSWSQAFWQLCHAVVPRVL